MRLAAVSITILLLSGPALAQDTEIFQASEKDDAARAKKLLDAKPELVKAKLSGDTPLHVAARRRARKVVEVLLEKGADLEARDRTCTPLLFAVAINAPLAFVELFLSKGADVNAKFTNLGASVLHAAKSKRVAELLLAKGADPNAPDTLGRTPLKTAREAGWKEVADFLAEHGATE